MRIKVRARANQYPPGRPLSPPAQVLKDVIRPLSRRLWDEEVACAAISERAGEGCGWLPLRSLRRGRHVGAGESAAGLAFAAELRRPGDDVRLGHHHARVHAGRRGAEGARVVGVRSRVTAAVDQVRRDRVAGREPPRHRVEGDRRAAGRDDVGGLRTVGGGVRAVLVEGRRGLRVRHVVEVGLVGRRDRRRVEAALAADGRADLHHEVGVGRGLRAVASRSLLVRARRTGQREEHRQRERAGRPVETSVSHLVLHRLSSAC